MRKPDFPLYAKKDADQLRGNREADQRLCFRYTDTQSLYFLNPKFQASSHLVWLYSLVCVGPGQKPRRPVFSERGSNLKSKLCNKTRDAPYRERICLRGGELDKTSGQLICLSLQWLGTVLKLWSKKISSLYYACHFHHERNNRDVNQIARMRRRPSER